MLHVHQACVLVVVNTLITNANGMILRSIGMLVRLWNLICLCADVLYLIQRKMSISENLTHAISTLCTSNHFLDAKSHLCGSFSRCHRIMDYIHDRDSSPTSEVLTKQLTNIAAVTARHKCCARDKGRIRYAASGCGCIKG